jgi:DNA-binding FadR family transcriptional regulator
MESQDHNATWLELRQTAAAVDAEVDRMLNLNCNLRRDKYLALGWLFQLKAHQHPVSPRGLERALNLTQSGTSRLLARMEDEALIHRSVSVTDKRAIEVTLTPSGVERLKRAQPFVTEAVRRALGDDATETSSPGAPAEAAAQVEEDMSISGILTWHTIDAVSAADALVVRHAIEPLVFAEAARYATEAATVDLTRDVIDMVRSTGDPAAFFAADSRFHEQIAELVQNRVLREIYRHLITQLKSFVRAVDGLPEAYEPYLAQRAKVHADLVDAISRHDMEAVAVAARQHHLERVVDVLSDPRDAATPE